MQLSELDAELAAVPGTLSVWCGPVGGPPAYTRHPDATHHAASTMKVAIIAALYRAAEAGTVALDAPVEVGNEFASALPGAPPFGCNRGYDNDSEVWDRLGGTASLRWLAERMIVRSSNLATNIVLSHVGLAPVAEVWRRVGAVHSVTSRGIEDFAARDAGVTNVVTAADLAALLSAITAGATSSDAVASISGAITAGTTASGATIAGVNAPDVNAAAAGPLAGPVSCQHMLDVLLAQQQREDLAAGLPPGTRIAHKNGWVRGVRHGAGVVFPPDAPAYAVVVCTTTPVAANEADAADPMCRLIARVAAASWADRHHLAGAATGRLTGPGG